MQHSHEKKDITINDITQQLSLSGSCQAKKDCNFLCRIVIIVNYRIKVKIESYYKREFSDLIVMKAAAFKKSFYE